MGGGSNISSPVFKIFTMQADRHNKGKPKYSLLDLNSFEDCVRVLEFGAEKYSRDNWKKGLPVSEILDSMLRHISAIQRGEFIDPESGLPHHGHISCNVMFLEHTIKNHPDLIDIPSIREQAEEYYGKKQEETDSKSGKISKKSVLEGYQEQVEKRYKIWQTSRRSSK